MATVCALILDQRGVPVTLWGRSRDHVADLIQTGENQRYLAGVQLPKSLRFTADPAEIASAQVLVNAIPTQFIRPVWTQLAPHAPLGVPIACVAKGIETGTLLRPTQVIADTLAQFGLHDDPDSPARPLATISGPNIAAELAKRLPATAVAASDAEPFAQQLQDLFSTDWFRVYTNADLLGVELAGATKNVIALAAGMLDGLQAGINAKSALLSRGLAEISRLGAAMGAMQETFFGVAGVGDLATTCFSPTGRNRSCGELLGKGMTLEQAMEQIPGIVEGVPTTKSVMQLAEKYRVEMPITRTIGRVLFEGLDPLAGIGELMARTPKPERIG